MGSACAISQKAFISGMKVWPRLRMFELGFHLRLTSLRLHRFRADGQSLSASQKSRAPRSDMSKTLIPEFQICCNHPVSFQSICGPFQIVEYF